MMLRPRAAIPALVAALVLVAPVLPVPAQETEPGRSTLQGKIYQVDGKSPAVNVSVLAVHLDTNEIFRADPTTADGKYEVSGLPYGYYNVVVETPEGLYLSNRILNIPPDRKVSASFVLSESLPEEKEWWEAEPTRTVPGLDRPPDGVARVIERSHDKGFWASKKGIATMAGGGAVILGLLISDGDDEPEEERASPSNP